MVLEKLHFMSFFGRPVHFAGAHTRNTNMMTNIIRHGDAIQEKNFKLIRKCQFHSFKCKLLNVLFKGDNGTYQSIVAFTKYRVQSGQMGTDIYNYKLYRKFLGISVYRKGKLTY